MGLFAKDRMPELAQVSPRIVLLIDDEDANLRAMQACLQKHYRVLSAHNGEQAIEIVKEVRDPDNLACIISDQRMPGLSGVEFFQRAFHLTPHSIRIIVTGFSDLDAIISSINNAEIFRFIVKPFDAKDFLQTVQKAVDLFDMKQKTENYYRDLEQKVKQRTIELEEKNAELERARHTLDEIALSDAQTGMRNRHFLLQRIDSDISIVIRRYEEWQKRGCPGNLLDLDLAFFYVDLDHFKAFNQHFGQDAGDAVLLQLRSRLQEVFRESDYLVRWGGDEFLLLARATNRSEAGVIAERIRHAVGGRPFQINDGKGQSKSCPLSCSIGFACFPFLPHAARALSWNQVVEMAEQAMLMAKDDGRNAWFGLYATDHTKPEDILQFVKRDCATAMQVGQIEIVKSIAASDR